MILAIVKHRSKKNKTKQISFQSWKWPEGFDDTQEQCGKTGDDYKKFMRQTGMGLEGTWRSPTPAFCLCDRLLKDET